VLEAQKWGMDYSLASRSVKSLRRHIVPFISYQYKIAPLIAESLVKRPWVIAKYAAIPAMAVAAVKEMHDMTDADWQKLKKELPQYIKRSGSYMIMPHKSQEGNWQWVNLEYYFPWGNSAALFRDIREGDWGEIRRDSGISNPFLDIYLMWASVRGDDPPKHPFYGTGIYNRLDPPHIKAAKTIEAMAFTWLPSMLSRKGALGYTKKAITGEMDKWGRKVTPAQGIGRWFGLNIVSTTPKQTKIIQMVKTKNLEKGLKQILRDPTANKKQKDQARKRFRKRVQEIKENK
jgi:hypothetical protein